MPRSTLLSTIGLTLLVHSTCSAQCARVARSVCLSSRSFSPSFTPAGTNAFAISPLAVAALHVVAKGKASLVAVKEEGDDGKLETLLASVAR